LSQEQDKERHTVRKVKTDQYKEWEARIMEFQSSGQTIADWCRVVTASMPSPVLPRSLVSPSLMAYIMTQKYCESMPLYRQEQYWSRQGIELSRQTLANWMIKGAKLHLDVLYKRMHQHLLQLDVLYADESTLQVINEPGRKATSSSYMWLYRSGREGPAIVLYEYQTTRASKHPCRFLSGFKGYLHVDGYAGYNNLPDVTLVGY